MSCRWSRTAAGIASGTATAIARRRRAKDRAVERRCIVERCFAGSVIGDN